MPQLLGKGWAVVARETGFSAARTPVIVSSHTVNPCLRRSKGCAILSVSPPTPALVPGSFWGSPTSVPMVWGILECLGNQGRRGLHKGVGWRPEGAHRHQATRGQERGLVGGSRGWGVSWGPRQLAEPGSREGPGQTVIIVLLGLREQGERTMLGPPKRGAVSGPRMAHDAPGSCLPSLSIPSPQYLIPCPSLLSLSGVGRELCWTLPTTILRRGLPLLRADKTKPLSFLPQPLGGTAWDPSCTLIQRRSRLLTSLHLRSTSCQGMETLCRSFLPFRPQFSYL